MYSPSSLGDNTFHLERNENPSGKAIGERSKTLGLEVDE
jgi:hypothetical protein